ncbi:hypothetical protein N9Y92_04565 [Chlamydiales bacterium]|nr:hypothetical protein [Chlamydiales bacterium]
MLEEIKNSFPNISCTSVDNLREAYDQNPLEVYFDTSEKMSQSSKEGAFHYCNRGEELLIVIPSKGKKDPYFLVIKLDRQFGLDQWAEEPLYKMDIISPIRSIGGVTLGKDKTILDNVISMVAEACGILESVSGFTIKKTKTTLDEVVSRVAEALDILPISSRNRSSSLLERFETFDLL